MFARVKHFGKALLRWDLEGLNDWVENELDSMEAADKEESLTRLQVKNPFWLGDNPESR